MNFLKMEGLGNDFIVTHEISPAEAHTIAGKRAEKLCDRHFGIGADGVALILPSDNADFAMRIFNSDGSEAEMCGNAIRCCAAYIIEKNLSAGNPLHFETKGGIRTTERLDGGRIRVNMGVPILEAKRIPTVKSSCRVVMHNLIVGCNNFKINAVSMGNPHAVIYVDEINDDHLKVCGPKIETHPFFPGKTNVEFVKVISNNEIELRVWERGCGETMACGTGACAAVVSGIINNLHGNEVTAHLLGGDLFITWRGKESDPVFMTGPATTVFSGSVSA